MNVEQARDFFNSLPETDNKKQVRVWLPGSRIYLSGPMMTRDEILIEGNLTVDSLLADGKGETV
jgi:hypothetical protein